MTAANELSGADGSDALWSEQANRIAETFGLGTPTGPLAPAAKGEQGVIWRLDTEQGAFAVKELHIHQREADVSREVGFQERAAATATAYEVASTRRTDRGQVLATVAGRQIRVQTWLDLTDPDPSIDPVLVGRMLAELHAARQPSTEEVDQWYTAAVGAARWQELVDELAATGSSAHERIAAVLARLIELESLLVPPEHVRICHRDLWADNVRLTRTGQLCVFDWDNCGPADPDQELAMLLYEYGLDSPERIGALNDAYRSAGGPGRVTRPGDLTMVIAQFGHFYEMAIETLLQPTVTPAQIAWASGRFDELEERPLTRDSIGLILAAAIHQRR